MEFKTRPNLVRVNVFGRVQVVEFENDAKCSDVVQHALAGVPLGRQFLSPTDSPNLEADSTLDNYRLVTTDGIWMEPSKLLLDYKVSKKKVNTLVYLTH
jgi:hypothetical protein